VVKKLEPLGRIPRKSTPDLTGIKWKCAELLISLICDISTHTPATMTRLEPCGEGRKHRDLTSLAELRQRHSVPKGLA